MFPNGNVYRDGVQSPRVGHLDDGRNGDREVRRNYIGQGGGTVTGG